VIKKTISVSSKELRTLVSDVTVMSLDLDQVGDYFDPEQGRSWKDKLRFTFLFNSFLVYRKDSQEILAKLIRSQTSVIMPQSITDTVAEHEAMYIIIGLLC
jgi:hypothetical protein